MTFREVTEQTYYWWRKEYGGLRLDPLDLRKKHGNTLPPHFAACTCSAASAGPVRVFEIGVGRLLIKGNQAHTFL